MALRVTAAEERVLLALRRTPVEWLEELSRCVFGEGSSATLDNGTDWGDDLGFALVALSDERLPDSGPLDTTAEVSPP